MQPPFSTQPLAIEPDWPETWLLSHEYDQVEIWGSPTNPAYACTYHDRMRRVLAAVRRHAPPGGSLLDIAAAQGNFALAASASGYRVTWNDLREELIGYVRRKSPEAEKLEFLPGNIFDIGDRLAGGFDTVLALEVIEHVAHPDAMLRLFGSLLRPGGRLILSTPNGGYLGNRLPRFSDCPDPSAFESEQFKPNSDGHIFLLHEDEMRSLAADAGLEVLEHRLFTNMLTAGYVGMHYFHRVLPRGAIDAIERVTARLPGPLSRRINVASLTVLAPRTAAEVS